MIIELFGVLVLEVFAEGLDSCGILHEASLKFDRHGLAKFSVHTLFEARLLEILRSYIT
jgi:hypothetical protein